RPFFDNYTIRCRRRQLPRGPSAMTVGPMFHTASVVPDLEKAREEPGRGLALTWTEPRISERVIHTETGDQEVTLRVVFSYEGPPHVELVEAQPGTIFGGAEMSVHHVGVWTDDVNAASERLVEQGLPWA